MPAEILKNWIHLNVRVGVHIKLSERELVEKQTIVTVEIYCQVWNKLPNQIYSSEQLNVAITLIA